MKLIGSYPSARLRRNRKTDWSRRLISENNLSVNDLILPIFIIDGKNKRESIKTMPGVYRYSIDKIPMILDGAVKNKIPMVALFPFTNSKFKNILSMSIKQSECEPSIPPCAACVSNPSISNTATLGPSNLFSSWPAFNASALLSLDSYSELMVDLCFIISIIFNSSSSDLSK